MKKISKFLVAVFLALGMVSMTQAQTTTTSTTLSAAITDKSERTFTVTSATGFTAGSTMAFVDNEGIAITAVSGTTITGRRGASGTASTHASGATIYVGPVGDGPFISSTGAPPAKSGSCTSGNELYLPQIDIRTGAIYNCTSSLWQLTNGPLTTATGITAIGPNAAGTVDLGSLDTAFRTAYLTSDINFEGSTANGVEAIVRHADPTSSDVVQTIPDTAGVADTFAMVTLAQTLANKTLTTPVIGAATGTSLDLTASLDVGVSGTTVGTVVMQNATSGTVTLQPTTGALGTVAATFPAAAITVPGTVYNDCGTANACSAVLTSSTMKVVTGITAALDGASPAIATVTGMPSFTGTSTYHCTASLSGATAAIAAMNIAVSNVSATSVTFTAANAADALVEYICIGW